ncbi:hypothetical protein K450DRAFT_220797 [Umbelopsis ramanniana AG]|uniref:Uncharacterized protein n=1 Tax=Umbelopsis ramanniana AG TaxID=1314678 RepID=A0AAD5EI43_UMBRA|nr:uncharacterized protein K450DRAFT_220797 [Umbelopsis ramanniana AG]KAI8583959.1 hypothetical protein K450DRAFT_220797 [Umbelopsis ramanniana AG]
MSVPLTNDMLGMEWDEIFSQIISLICISVLSILFGAKSTIERLRHLTYARLLVLLIYIASWAFTTASTILVATNNFNQISCTLSILTCDVFYAGSKILIYAWLIERIWVVEAVKTRRLKTPLYRFHIVLLMPYFVIFSLMVVYRESYLEENGACTIGLQPPAAVPLMVYDFIFNLYMTGLFIRPLMQHSVQRGFASETQLERCELRVLAKRTLVASVVCLLVSLANILILAILKRERGLICLTCCTFDVTVNAVTIHFVTNRSSPVRQDIFVQPYRDTHISDRDTDIFAMVDEHDSSTKASQHTMHTNDGERLNETFAYNSDIQDVKY